MRIALNTLTAGLSGLGYNMNSKSLEKFIEHSKIEQDFWDNCDRNRNDKKAFLKAVRRTFKDAIELRKSFVVETASGLLYAYSNFTDSFQLLGTAQ